MDIPTEQNFDFLAVVTGRAYPSDEVKLNMAEAIAYEVKKTEQLISTIPDATKEQKALREDLEKKVAELRKEMSKYELTFVIRGVSRSAILEPLHQKIKENYPDQKQTISGISIDVPHKDFQYHYNIAELHAHVEVVKNHEGKTRVIGLDEFTKFMNDAPDSQVKKLEKAIRELSVEARFFEEQISEDF